MDELAELRRYGDLQEEYIQALKRSTSRLVGFNDLLDRLYAICDVIEERDMDGLASKCELAIMDGILDAIVLSAEAEECYLILSENELLPHQADSPL